MNPRDLGFGNTSDTRKTYFTVVGGKFSIAVEEGTSDAVSRINKENKLVWELQYNKLEDVYIRNIVKDTTGKFGAQWIVTLEKNGNLLELKMPWSGRQTMGLLMRLPNIEIDKPITLILYTYENTSLVVYQNGVKIEKFFTKENLNGMPEAVWIEVDGIPKLDFGKQVKFLHQMIEDGFRPYFDSLPAISPITATAPSGEPIKPITSVPKEQSDEMDAYLKDCEQGFPGTIEEWRIEMAGPVYSSPATKTPPPPVGSAVTRTAPASPAAKTPAAPPNKPPGPKLAGTPAPVNIAQAPVSETNYSGVKGATIPADQSEQIWKGNYAEVKRLGYTGGYETFIAVCDTLGIGPGDAVLNDKGKLVKSGLPF